MSLRSDIKNALASRLLTITTTNGYSLTIANVYANKIPMGLNLEPHEVPAILLIPGTDTVDPKGQNRIYCDWTLYLQLIHEDVTDDVMLDFIDDVAKAIFANSATADRQDEYRTIHPAIYKLDIIEIEPDLNMIEANRFAIIELKIKYTTKYNVL